LYNGVVDLDEAGDGVKKCSEGQKPLGLQVGKGGGDIYEEGDAGASGVLHPGDGDAKEFTGLGGAAPVSEKLL
jgi:hypothetical protein